MPVTVDKTFNLRYRLEEDKRVAVVLSFRPDEPLMTGTQLTLNGYFPEGHPIQLSDMLIRMVACKFDLDVLEIPTKFSFVTPRKLNPNYLLARFGVFFLSWIYEICGRERYHRAYNLNK